MRSMLLVAARVAGFVITIRLWQAIMRADLARVRQLVVVIGAVLLVFPVTWLGRQALDRRATTGGIAWATTVVHLVLMDPMVLCTLLTLLSAGLYLQSLDFVLWVVLLVGPAWIYFLKAFEERELEIRFGPSYAAYRASTPFLWPRRPRTR